MSSLEISWKVVLAQQMSITTRRQGYTELQHSIYVHYIYGSASVHQEYLQRPLGSDSTVNVLSNQYVWFCVV